MNDTVIYEPEHDADTMETIERRLESRGYTLAPGALGLVKFAASVERHGRLMVCTTHDEVAIDDIGQHETAADYAETLAGALDQLMRS